MTTLDIHVLGGGPAIVGAVVEDVVGFVEKVPSHVDLSVVRGMVIYFVNYSRCAAIGYQVRGMRWLVECTLPSIQGIIALV